MKRTDFHVKTTRTCKECGSDYQVYNTMKGCPKCKKPTRINPVSDKRKEENAEYSQERLKFLRGKTCPVTGLPATEVHHTNKRNGQRLNDQKYWLAVTREGHDWIHAHPKEAKEAGWLL